MGISHSLKIIVVAALEITRYTHDRFILVFASVLHFRHPLSEKSERGRGVWSKIGERGREREL